MHAPRPADDGDGETRVKCPGPRNGSPITSFVLKRWLLDGFVLGPLHGNSCQRPCIQAHGQVAYVSFQDHPELNLLRSLKTIKHPLTDLKLCENTNCRQTKYHSRPFKALLYIEL